MNDLNENFCKQLEVLAWNTNITGDDILFQMEIAHQESSTGQIWFFQTLELTKIFWREKKEEITKKLKGMIEQSLNLQGIRMSK
jgi:hypothetical protein